MLFFISNGINVKIELTDVFPAGSQVYTIKHALSSMRLADRHATWPVGKTSLHLDPHCDPHHLLQQCHPHIKQHHLGEIEVQRDG